MVLRFAVERITSGYKPGWLYYKCKEEGLLDIFYQYQKNGYFNILENGKKSSSENLKLSIELVPRSCWFENVRSEVSNEEWDKLKKETSKRANRRCEVCGGRGPKWPVECHEVWHYDDSNFAQILKGLVALCPSCHEVKHIGFTQLKGKEVEATAHLAIVNGWSYQKAQQYVEKSFEVWSERSNHTWKLDISWLENLGIETRSSKEPIVSLEKSPSKPIENSITQNETEIELPIKKNLWQKVLYALRRKKA